MTDVDRLLVAATREPDDGTIRLVASDAIREWGDPVLAHAVEDDETGPALMKALKDTVKQIGMPVSINLLWCQYHVLSRLAPNAEVSTDLAPLVQPVDDAARLRGIMDRWQRDYRGMWTEPMWVAPQPEWRYDQTVWTDNTRQE